SIGVAMALMPLQFGAPELACPRLNAFSYWAFAFGSIIMMSGFFTPSGAASAGWFSYAPLADSINSPGVGGDLWTVGLYMSGIGTTLGAVNHNGTLVGMRATGMDLFPMT